MRRKARHKVRQFVRNPIVIVLMIVGVLLLGWNHYLAASRDLDMPTDNILPGGGFDTLGANSLPKGWSTATSGHAHVQISSTKGYVNGNALRLQVSGYVSGDATLQSPRVSVEPHHTYFFKGFYEASTSVDLLVRSYYTNGTTELRQVQRFAPSADAWTTASTAFASGGYIQSVQFVYRLSGNGFARFDETYLEQKDGLHVGTPQTGGRNLFRNGDVHDTSGGKPADWNTYHSGINHPSFSYQSQGTEPYVRTTLSEYKTGEAKWQQAPLHASQGQLFRFGLTYRSDVHSEVVAEYTLQNGKRVFDTLATLAPAGDWTYAETQLEAPAGAKSVFVSVVLHANGTLDTRNYQLRDITKAGPTRWHRPLISLTFDDGWESTYRNGLPLLDRYGFKGTFYLNPSSVDTRNFMSVAQLKSLQRDGHELASHGYDHIDMTTVNSKRLASEIQGAYDYLRQTFGRASQDFAVPYGNTDAEVQTQARAYYRSLRLTTDGINTKQNFDPYQLRVLYVSDTTPTQHIQDAINQARQYNGWLVIVYHQIAHTKTNDGKEGANVSPASFAQQLQLIHQSRLSVLTVQTALDEVQAQNH